MTSRILLIIIFVCANLYNSAMANDTKDLQLKNIIKDRLYQQTEDIEVSNELADFIVKDILTWKTDTVELSKANSILAFAFGNIYAKNGNQILGKMNKQLADMVVKIYNQKQLPVYAQWEIAEAIGDRIPKKDIHSIYPIVDDSGLEYLDTAGVAKDALRQAGGIDNISTAIVIAFKEHELRAVRTARELGIDAYAPKGIKLPDDYDKYSGQPWTRDKLTFMLYEIRTRANLYREELSGKILKK